MVPNNKLNEEFPTAPKSTSQTTFNNEVIKSMHKQQISWLHVYNRNIYSFNILQKLAEMDQANSI